MTDGIGDECAQGTQAGITAIIPVYNGARFITHALRSVQQQTRAVDAIIVIDDCSRDDTARIVQSMADSDKRITLLRNEQNRGPAFSRNRALEHATTPYAAFLDADDVWTPAHIEHIARAFQKFPGATIAYADEIGQGMTVEAEADLLDDPIFVLLDVNPIPQSATAVRIAPVLETGGYSGDARHSEDYELWLRLALSGATFAHAPVGTLRRLTHSDQVSVKDAHRMYGAAWRTRRAVAESYGTPQTGTLDPRVTGALKRAMGRELDDALNSRRRENIELLISLTDWVPDGSQQRARAARVLGWRWPLWKATTLLYDGLPTPLRQWLAKARR